MRAMRFSVRFMFTLLTVALGTAEASGQNADLFVQWYQGLRDLSPDAERGATVEGLTLVRDVGTFHLDQGKIHLLEPIDGRGYGAVFSGAGRFEMSVPDVVEEGQLRREYDEPSVSVPFKAAVFLFTDSTQVELTSALSWGPLAPDRDAEREAREARDYFTDDDGWVSRKLMLPLINAGTGFFYAHFSQDRGDPMIFSVDPHVFEEVSLAKRAKRAKRPEVVTQFHKALDYTTGRSIPQEGLDLITISAYDIETTIEGNLDLIGRATATLRRVASDFDWVPFSLYWDLDVDSVQWQDGSPAEYYRAEEGADIWVNVSSAPTDEASLTFHYSGDMMDRPRDLWVVLGTHSTWYPVYEFGRRIPYKLTFRAPEDYIVTTVGALVEETTEDEVTTRVWETPPVQMITFNIGEFDEFESVVPGAPPLTVLINEQAHRVLAGLVSDAGGILYGQRDMADNVAIDLRNSFRFYNDVYGPTPVDHFIATEIPYSHGEAYPGLLMLAWSTFQYTRDAGSDEIFRAHEVAHQWWGIGVRPATYRDWWLAEGFSEFSGWWYAARARGAVELYMTRLKETREEILDRRDEAGPVGLGQRVRSTEDPEDYQLTIYSKSAWILHMLRTMLTDADTGNDDLFTQVMQTFYAAHVGGTATTLDFQQAVEEVVGADMSWFFDQWVHGTSIPTYRFSYNYEDQPDGQVKATVRVRQERVPDDFQMIVPILLDFGDEGTAVVTINVMGPVTERELPLLPRRPDEIVFNPYESVLAETKTERWRN